MILRVVIHPEPEVGLVIAPSSLCIGDIATVYLESGVYNQLAWENSSNGINWNLVAGKTTDTVKSVVSAPISYRVTLTTHASCGTITSAPVSISTTTVPPTPTISLSEQEICSGEDVQLEVVANGAVPQTWQMSLDGEITWVDLTKTSLEISEQLTNTTATPQSVSYRAVNALTCGTTYSSIETVSVYPTPAGTITINSNCETLNTIVVFESTGPFGIVEWQSSSDSLTWKFITSENQLALEVQEETFIRVIFDNDLSFGCEDTSNVMVFTKCEFDAPPVKIPNAITPNGDGSNDVFFVNNIEFYPDNVLKIFNRWGSLVYEETGYLNEWEGTHNGKLLPTGTYYYVLNLNDGSKDFKGYVMILE